MTFVRKVDGAPGCGKTTYMFDDIASHADDGVRLEDIYIVTFTRSGRADAVEELGKVYGANLEDLKDQVRTFHGASLVQCLKAGIVSDPSQQLLIPDSTPEIYQEFAHQECMEFRPDNRSDWVDIDAGEIDDCLGNRIFKISEWLSLRRLDNDQHHRSPIGTQLPHGEVVDILDRWETFKQHGTLVEHDNGDVTRERYVEHHDYIELAIENGLVPSGKYLYVDEFQDLSPQEYVLFKQWRESGEFDTITVAGDPEQAIYGFREATSYFFEEMPVDDVVTLKTSYRNPSNISAVGRATLDSHPDTDPRDFDSHDMGGVAKELYFDGEVDLVNAVEEATETFTYDGGADVFLLTRTNSQANSICSTFEENGIPYTRLGKEYQTWTDSMAELLPTLAAMDRNEPVTVSRMNNLVFHHEDTDGKLDEYFENRAVFDRLDNDEALYPVEYAEPFPDSVNDIIPQFEKLTKKQQSVFKTAFSGNAPNHPRDVCVGTIHSAKGLEAECVFLFEEISKKTAEAYHNSHESAVEEHRLFYVGATRARSSLYLVSDFAYGSTFPGYEAGALSRAGI